MHIFHSKLGAGEGLIKMVASKQSPPFCGPLSFGVILASLGSFYTYKFEAKLDVDSPKIPLYLLLI